MLKPVVLRFVFSAAALLRPRQRVGRKKGWRGWAQWALAFGGAATAMATTVVPPDFTALVNDSDVIVHAITKRVESEKRVGAHGVKIVTRVDLEVVEVVAGWAPSRLTLELLGGRVGNEQLSVAGMPSFHPGDEDILFVSGNGRRICPLYGMMHGRYAIVKDPATGRRYVRRSDGTPLRSTAQISWPLEEKKRDEVQRKAALATALGPAEFIREIRAAVQPDGKLNREN